MKLNESHRDFWLWHRGPKALKPKEKPSVDSLINAQLPRRDYHHAGNVIALLNGIIRRKEDLRAYLHRLSTNPGTVIRPERRAAYARKWLSRINSNS